MIISITGVPGVGKSQVARLLAKRLKAELISITALIRAGKIHYTWDPERKTKVITPKAVSQAVLASTKPGTNIVEGHLAHLIKADAIFILRCNPAVLRKRLMARRWTKAKIAENVQAETLDIITAEAVASTARRKGERKCELYEIDTTRRKPQQTARTILRVLKSPAYGKKFKPGRIKWLKPGVILAGRSTSASCSQFRTYAAPAAFATPRGSLALGRSL